MNAEKLPLPTPSTPDHSPLALHSLVEMLRGRRTVVLAGAGCSTESGIPDYRGPEGRNKVRSPVQYRDFVGSAEARARYWARSTVGWTRVGSASPNDAHRALAALEADGPATSAIPPLEELDVGDRSGLFDAPEPDAPPAVERPAAKGGAWFPSAENVVLHGPRIEQLLQEELD